jgi:putative ABC transport system permease protein
MDTLWTSARIMAPMGNEISRTIPGVEKVAVFRHKMNVSLGIDQKKYQTGHLIFAQPEFIELFTMPLKIGDPVISLKDPKSVLITDTIAKTYFEGRDPIGQTITLDDEIEYKITGILENIPRTTQLHCDFIASYSTLNTIGVDLKSWIDNRSDLTYLMLTDRINPKTVESQINDVFAKHVTNDISQRYTFSLKPFNEIYYNTYTSGNYGELTPGWEPDMIIFLVGIGLFILIQSIVNFISLSTAQATDRLKEVGIRKTLGAGRMRLALQFLGETMILTVVALFISQFFYEIIKIGYNANAPTAYQKTYELANLYGDAGSILLLFLMTIVVAVLAGFYPALYLSRLKPISILQDETRGITSKSLIRKIMVVFQFTLAIFFITVTIGLYRQKQLITEYDLGFDHNNIMVIRFDECGLETKDCTIMKNEILAKNDVLGVSRTQMVMGRRHWSTILYTNPEREETDRKYAKLFDVDYNFLPFFGIEILEGRGFSSDKPDDINHGVIINESMKNELGLNNAIGYKLYNGNKVFEVIGVVEDFKGSALDWSYSPNSVIFLNPDSAGILNVKLKSDNINESIAAIKETWHGVFRDYDFNYSFLDDNIRNQYKDLNALVPMFAVLAFISIIIGCLGILGLVSFTVEKKTKETAIRKILGASVGNIYKNLTKDFVILIAIANLIAFPLAYLLVTASNEEYPFRASMGVETYIFGGLLTIFFALIVSAYHVTKAALTNPAEVLNQE